MEILKMIEDWRNGCELARTHPVECPACTMKLIDTIELKERVNLHSGCITPKLHAAIDRLRSAISSKDHVRGDSCLVKQTDLHALITEFFRLDKELQHLKPYITINTEDDYRCT